MKTAKTLSSKQSEKVRKQSQVFALRNNEVEKPESLRLEPSDFSFFWYPPKTGAQPHPSQWCWPKGYLEFNNTVVPFPQWNIFAHRWVQITVHMKTYETRRGAIERHLTINVTKTDTIQCSIGRDFLVKWPDRWAGSPAPVLRTARSVGNHDLKFWMH